MLILIISWKVVYLARFDDRTDLFVDSKVSFKLHLVDVEYKEEEKQHESVSDVSDFGKGVANILVHHDVIVQVHDCH